MTLGEAGTRLCIMKNRDSKEEGLGVISHIYNRGNNKEKIFFDEQDYKAFLFRLGLCMGYSSEELNKEELISLPYSRIRITETKKDQFRIHAFCLMPNHFHILIEQNSDIPVSKIILKLCTSYAMYINKKHKRVGHLFQDQFKSVIIGSDSQLAWTSAYIHMNPVKDKIVSDPRKYKWSSYNDYSSNRNFILTYKNTLEDFFDKKDFEKETRNLLLNS